MALAEFEGALSTGIPATAAAAETSGHTPRVSVLVGSFAAIMAAWAAALLVNAGDRPSALVLPVGVSVFAMFYAVTQGLERLLEPLSGYFYGTKAETMNRDAAVAVARNLHAGTTADPARQAEQVAGVAGQTSRPTKRANPTSVVAKLARAEVKQTLETLAGPDAEAAATDGVATLATRLVAVTQAELDQRRADKTVAYWALASVLGVLLSGTLGLYLLHVVGLRGDGVDAGNGQWSAAVWSAPSVRHMIDVLLTGLAIGGGTKPLHDLIANLQAAKDGKKDPKEVG